MTMLGNWYYSRKKRENPPRYSPEDV